MNNSQDRRGHNAVKGKQGFQTVEKAEPSKGLGELNNAFTVDDLIVHHAVVDRQYDNIDDRSTLANVRDVLDERIASLGELAEPELSQARSRIADRLATLQASDENESLANCPRCTYEVYSDELSRNSGICDDCVDDGGKVLHVGQTVYWEDPRGLTSGEYEVTEANPDGYGSIMLSNGYSDIEAFDTEVTVKG